MFPINLRFLLYLAAALTTRAYLITAPSDLASSGAFWTSMGPNTIIWQHVSTDPDSFSIVLVNEDRSVISANNQLLASAVDGTILSIAVSPPSGQTFPVGSGFRVNFIKGSDVNTIYAQSSQFRITPGDQGMDTEGGSTSTPASNMSSTMRNDISGGTESQMPHTTYFAPPQTQTVTTTIGSSQIGSSPDGTLLTLVCAGGLALSSLWGTLI